MDSRMYETLTSIPLFQGISGIELNRILDNIPLHIELLGAGDVFAQQGDYCQHMVFLLNGTLQCETTSPDQSYRFTEFRDGPSLLEGDIIYGIQRQWSSTYTATNTCRLMAIPKSDVNRMLVSIEVFRINYLNALCTLAVRRRQNVWKSPSPTLRHRFVQFVRSHAICPHGRKILYIRMQDLGEQIGGTRALISDMLHQMQGDGMLKIKRNIIEIPSLDNFQ